MASVIDPIGLFAPFTLRMNISLKTTWAKNGEQWDDKMKKKRQREVLAVGQRNSGMEKAPLKRRYYDINYENKKL